MAHRYEAAWWSIAMPDGWQAESDESCTTLMSDTGVGALQLSAYQNEDGPITNDALNEFVLEESLDAVLLTEVKRGDFEGLTTQYREDGTYWRKAWLKNANILLYVTYNCSAGAEAIEKDVVDNMLHSLKRL
jgi:hypothetical protein